MRGLSVSAPIATASVSISTTVTTAIARTVAAIAISGTITAAITWARISISTAGNIPSRARAIISLPASGRIALRAGSNSLILSLPRASA